MVGIFKSLRPNQLPLNVIPGQCHSRTNVFPGLDPGLRFVQCGLVALSRSSHDGRRHVARVHGSSPRMTTNGGERPRIVHP